jgi:hypothetical protein
MCRRAPALERRELLAEQHVPEMLLERIERRRFSSGLVV